MVLLALDALDEVKGAKEEIQQYLERYYRINLAAFVYPPDHITIFGEGLCRCLCSSLLYVIF